MLGCTIFQAHEDGDRKPIRYWTIFIEPEDKNLLASEREFVDVVLALLTLRSYI